jgi:ABC-type glycerol-3-phosphate transport system permease component
MSATATRPAASGRALDPLPRRRPLLMRRRAGRVTTYLALVLACVVTLVPLVVIGMASLKTGEEFLSEGPFDPPQTWLNPDNFVRAFTDGDMLRAFGNTTVILVVSVSGTVLIGSMAAYAVDRFRFRMRGVVLGAFLLAALVPGVTTQVATFQVVNSLGVFNTMAAPILLFMGTDIVSIYIFLQFMRSIPRELDEAATLEGANRFTIYWRIILPLLKPAIATVVIVKGIAIYNEFYIPFLYMPSRELGVISTSLFRFQGPFSAEWEVVSAGVVIVIVPTLVVFLLLQRWFYNGITAGAVK